MSIELAGRFADEELRSLHGWLQRDPAVRRNVRMQLAPIGPTAGQMGNTLDLITMFVTSGLALPNFVQTLLTWRETRRQKCTITLTVDGIVAVIEGIDQDTAADIAARLVEQDGE
nr:CobW-like GTP-binding protein [Actinomadura macra]